MFVVCIFNEIVNHQKENTVFWVGHILVKCIRIART